MCVYVSLFILLFHADRTDTRSTVVALIALCHLLVVTKCRKNRLLTKKRQTNAEDFVDFSATAVSSCDTSERFDDGTDRENIKCTTDREHVGIWSHREYSCHGIARNSFIKRALTLTVYHFTKIAD